MHAADSRSGKLTSFANQALAAEYRVRNDASLEKKVSPVPEEMDRGIAALKLKAMGVEWDVLSEEQVRYLNSWEDVGLKSNSSFGKSLQT